MFLNKCQLIEDDIKLKERYGSNSLYFSCKETSQTKPEIASLIQTSERELDSLNNHLETLKEEFSRHNMFEAELKKPEYEKKIQQLKEEVIRRQSIKKALLKSIQSINTQDISDINNLKLHYGQYQHQNQLYIQSQAQLLEKLKKEEKELQRSIKNIRTRSNELKTKSEIQTVPTQVAKEFQDIIVWVERQIKFVKNNPGNVQNVISKVLMALDRVIDLLSQCEGNIKCLQEQIAYFENLNNREDKKTNKKMLQERIVGYQYRIRSLQNNNESVEIDVDSLEEKLVSLAKELYTCSSNTREVEENILQLETKNTDLQGQLQRLQIEERKLRLELKGEEKKENPNKQLTKELQQILEKNQEFQQKVRVIFEFTKKEVDLYLRSNNIFNVPLYMSHENIKNIDFKELCQSQKEHIAKYIEKKEFIPDVRLCCFTENDKEFSCQYIIRFTRNIQLENNRRLSGSLIKPYKCGNVMISIHPQQIIPKEYKGLEVKSKFGERIPIYELSGPLSFEIFKVNIKIQNETQQKNVYLFSDRYVPNDLMEAEKTCKDSLPDDLPFLFMSIFYNTVGPHDLYFDVSANFQRMYTKNEICPLKRMWNYFSKDFSSMYISEEIMNSDIEGSRGYLDSANYRVHWGSIQDPKYVSLTSPVSLNENENVVHFDQLHSFIVEKKYDNIFQEDVYLRSILVYVTQDEKKERVGKDDIVDFFEKKLVTKLILYVTKLFQSEIRVQNSMIDRAVFLIKKQIRNAHLTENLLFVFGRTMWKFKNENKSIQKNNYLTYYQNLFKLVFQCFSSMYILGRMFKYPNRKNLFVYVQYDTAFFIKEVVRIIKTSNISYKYLSEIDGQRCIDTTTYRHVIS